MGHHTNVGSCQESTLQDLAAVDFATETTLLSLGLRMASSKLGTDGQVLAVSSVAVRSAQLTAETLWELCCHRAVWYRQGGAAVTAAKETAGSSYLPADTPRLLVVTGAADDYVSIVAADDPSTDIASQVVRLNQLKADYEAHRVATPSVHAHADATNNVTAADATEAASAYTLANDIKAQCNAHFAEVSTLEEACTALNDTKAQYEAHRVLTAGGVHGAADATNVITAADATNLATGLLLANDIKAMCEAHRVLISGGEHGAADTVNVITSPDATDLASLVTLTNEEILRYEAHRVLIAGSVHGAADATNVVTAPAAGTADIHKTDDTAHVIAAADATDLPTLTALVAELWDDYNAHLNDGTVHVAADADNLLSWGVASLTLEE